MTRQEIIEWIQYRNFPYKVFAETYIRENQKGVIYPQQQDALDFYYGAGEPQTTFEKGGALDRLQRGEVTEIQTELERPVLPEGEVSPESTPVVTPIPATEEERQSLARRLFNNIRKYLGQ